MQCLQTPSGTEHRQRLQRFTAVHKRCRAAIRPQFPDHGHATVMILSSRQQKTGAVQKSAIDDGIQKWPARCFSLYRPWTPRHRCAEASSAPIPRSARGPSCSTSPWRSFLCRERRADHTYTAIGKFCSIAVAMTRINLATIRCTAPPRRTSPIAPAPTFRRERRGRILREWRREHRVDIGYDV